MFKLVIDIPTSVMSVMNMHTNIYIHRHIYNFTIDRHKIIDIFIFTYLNNLQ